MTYEELLLSIDDVAPSLPSCALRLLIRLIGIAIRTGSNEVRISARSMSSELGMTRDAVRVGSRSLSHIVDITAPPGTAMTFVLPVEWFSSQRSLFAFRSRVEKPTEWPGNQATVDEKPGHQWTRNQATSGRETRPLWPGNQATWTRNQATSGRETRPPGLETRPLATQNQQLTDAGDEIRSDLSVFSKRESIDVIDQIIATKLLKFDQQQAAETLEEHLKAYVADFGPTMLQASSVSDKILARCLVCAPLDDLIFLLRSLREQGKRVGKSYAWFLTVFAQKLRGIPPEALSAALAQEHRRKQPTRETEAGNGLDFLNLTFRKVRTLQ